MNIQIDTNNKTIKLQEAVNLGEFREILLKLFPNDEWKEYKLETNTIINNWTNPIIVERHIYKDYFPWWSNQPYYVGDLPGTLSTSFTATMGGEYTGDNNAGVYNVSIID